MSSTNFDTSKQLTNQQDRQDKDNDKELLNYFETTTCTTIEDVKSSLSPTAVTAADIAADTVIDTSSSTRETNFMEESFKNLTIIEQNENDNDNHDDNNENLITIPSSCSNNNSNDDIIISSILPTFLFNDNDELDDSDIDAFFSGEDKNNIDFDIDSTTTLALHTLLVEQIEQDEQEKKLAIIKELDEEENEEEHSHIVTKVEEEEHQILGAQQEDIVLSSEGLIDLFDNTSWYNTLNNEEDEEEVDTKIELLQPQEYQTIFYEDEVGKNHVVEDDTYLQLESIFDKLTLDTLDHQDLPIIPLVEEMANDMMYYDEIYCLPCNDGTWDEERINMMYKPNDVMGALTIDDAGLDLDLGSQDENQMFTEEELIELKKGADGEDGVITDDCFEKNRIGGQDMKQVEQQQYVQQQPRGKPQQLINREKAQSVENDTNPRPYPQQHPNVNTMHQIQSFNMVQPIIESFKQKKNERQCFGHKELIFGLSLSPCGKFCASASQDSTVCIWNVEKNSLVATLKGHDKESECLRVTWASKNWSNDSDDHSILASGGADGLVKVWRKTNVDEYNWRCVATLDHTEAKAEPSKDNNADVYQSNEQDDEKNDDNDIPQIYAVQFIDQWCGLPSMNIDSINNHTSFSSNPSCLISSSDDFIHIWQLVDDEEDTMKFEKIMDIKFTHLEHGYGGVFVHLHNKKFVADGSVPITEYSQSSNIISNKKAFGGDRNPDNLVYVFDAEHCPSNNLLGVALSDGTLRLVNGRGVCVTILQLPGCQSHLTSFSWDTTGERLATCVATGHVILWQLHFGRTKDQVRPSCRAVLEGGHTERRPLFGAKYFGGEDEVSETNIFLNT